MQNKHALKLILHKNQETINLNPARFKVIKAGKRFGKTKLSIYRAIQIAALYPNEVIWYIAPTYAQAENIAWRELNDLIPNGHPMVRKTLGTRLIKLFINGSEIKLIGADNEDGLRGPKLRHVVFDECAYIKEYVWSGIIRSQLLGSINESQGTADFISSPNSRGRNWYSKFWDDAKKKEMSGDKNWAAFYYTIYDNPTITKEAIDEIKRDTTDETWNTEYMAIESNLSGIIYHEFTDNHVGEFKCSSDSKLVRGLDWGLNHPTVCLWLNVDIKNKKVYIENEFVKTDCLINESADMVKKMTGSREVEWSVIDPSTNKQNSQTGRTDRDEFMRYGIYCIPADNRDRGYDITKMFFKRDMIMIHPKCKNLIYGLKNLQHSDKFGDDCTDALRYAIVRIHDVFFGGTLFESDSKQTRKRSNPNEVFFDELGIKPFENQDQLSWFADEIAA